MNIRKFVISSHIKQLFFWHANHVYQNKRQMSWKKIRFVDSGFVKTCDEQTRLQVRILKNCNNWSCMNPNCTPLLSLLKTYLPMKVNVSPKFTTNSTVRSFKNLSTIFIFYNILQNWYVLLFRSKLKVVFLKSTFKEWKKKKLSKIFIQWI